MNTGGGASYIHSGRNAGDRQGNESSRQTMRKRPADREDSDTHAGKHIRQIVGGMHDALHGGNQGQAHEEHPAAGIEPGQTGG